MPNFVSTLTIITYQNDILNFIGIKINTHLKAVIEPTHKKRHVLYSRGPRKVTLFFGNYNCEYDEMNIHHGYIL